MTVLVTGGLGYIGSHVVRLLLQRGDDVVIVNDRASGSPRPVDVAPLVELDIASEHATETLTDAMREHAVTSVVHLAGRKSVGESMSRPDWYYQQNVGGTINLVAAMAAAEVTQIVFSSSASVYGDVEDVPVTESTALSPVNPYGMSKKIGELLLEGMTLSTPLRAVSLRYFNAAGAGWQDLGDPGTGNLIPLVFDRIQAGLPPVVYGNDYPTADGTCVRDYVHVLDLATAHLSALDSFAGGAAPYRAFNVGTGNGLSVLEVIDTIARVTDRDLVPTVIPRRDGDPASVVAETSLIQRELGWNAHHTLHDMVDSAWKARTGTSAI